MLQIIKYKRFVSLCSVIWFQVLIRTLAFLQNCSNIYKWVRGRWQCFFDSKWSTNYTAYQQISNVKFIQLPLSSEFLHSIVVLAKAERQDDLRQWIRKVGLCLKFQEDTNQRHTTIYTQQFTGSTRPIYTTCVVQATQQSIQKWHA